MTEMTERESLAAKAPTDLQNTLADLDSIGQNIESVDRAYNHHRLCGDAQWLDCDRSVLEKFDVSETVANEFAAPSVYRDYQNAAILQHISTRSFADTDRSKPESPTTIVAIPESFNYSCESLDSQGPPRSLVSDYQAALRGKYISRAAASMSRTPNVSSFLVRKDAADVIGNGHPAIVNGHDQRLERFVAAVREIEPPSLATAVLKEVRSQARQFRTASVTGGASGCATPREPSEPPQTDPITIAITPRDISDAKQVWQADATSEWEEAKNRQSEHPGWPEDLKSFQRSLSTYKEPTTSQEAVAAGKEELRLGRDLALTQLFGSVAAPASSDVAETWNNTDLTAALFGGDNNGQNTNNTLDILFYRDPEVPSPESLLPDENTITSALEIFRARAEQDTGNASSTGDVTLPETTST
ncbi:hypothetical protein IAU59_005539 [Kwoniella sp. CBS 9459]